MTPDPDSFLARLRALYSGEQPKPDMETDIESRRALLAAVTGFEAKFVRDEHGTIRGVVAGGFPMDGIRPRGVALSCAIRF